MTYTDTFFKMILKFLTTKNFEFVLQGLYAIVATSLCFVYKMVC